MRRPESVGAGWADAAGALHGGVYKGVHDTPVLGGFIKIEIQRQGTNPTNGVWQDVTGEVLALGIAGRNLADCQRAARQPLEQPPDVRALANDICREPNPNAIIRLQRVRDIPISMAPCGVTLDVAGVVTAVSQNEHDYWPNTLYDAREASTRDATADRVDGYRARAASCTTSSSTSTTCAGGSLVSWPRPAAPNGANAKNDNGYIVYFSDRRGNKNRGATGGGDRRVRLRRQRQPRHGRRCPQWRLLDVGEDVNGNDVLDSYGRTARNVPAFPRSDPTGTPCVAGYPNPLHGATQVTQVLTNATRWRWLARLAAASCGVTCRHRATVKTLIARANRPLFFRRALKIVNGGAWVNLPQAV